ncbi:MAG TPA: hypothetical protein VNA65_00030, partial [Candidatus Dormibacteraeota bacterium]|nr:hypothetical protein [Candidatus Dormibacteraeota bacterium]
NNLVTTPGVGGVGNLLTNNPNKDALGQQANPVRYSANNVADILTCDQNHNYGDEQKAFDGGNEGPNARALDSLQASFRPTLR